MGSVAERIGDYFEWDAEGTLVRIKPSPIVDLDYQERLTRCLFECRPHYQIYERKASLVADITAYIQRMEAELGITVSITSDGPRRGNKRARRGDAFAAIPWHIQVTALGHQNESVPYAVANASPF